MASTKKPRARATGTGPKPLAIRTALRVSCEQRVRRLLRTAKDSLWTLRQVRHAMRRARERLLLQWGGDAFHPVVARRVSSAWYRAIRCVCGVPLRKLTDLRQMHLPFGGPT